MAKQQRKKRERKEWYLLQSRVDLQSGRELRELAEEDGLQVSVYFRRLVLRHLAEVRASRAAAQKVA